MGAQEKSPNANNSLQRVKVYRLNADGRWDDQGTGHVAVDYLERSEDLGLFVVDEEDNETLLMHRISSDDIYRKQEDTIISWRDPEFSTELALSFQETTGCSYIWDHICNAQRNLHFNSLTNDTFNNVNNDLRELPAVQISNLRLILKIVVESGITDQLRVSELIMHDQDFFRKLVELFRTCEDLENIDELHLLFRIVRGIIQLNNTQIFEKMFDDDVIMDVIGCLEYDPEGPQVNHRNFLKEQVVFKEVIPIKNPTVLSRIHQTYRLSYLKDVILPRALDDSVVANLNSIIHSNNAIIVSLLKDDSNFIRELFSRLKSPTVPIESKKALVQFLHEFCILSKSLQMVNQLRIYRDLASEGIFDIIADVLRSDEKKLVLTGTDILIHFMNQDPNILRTYVARQEGVLLGLLVKGMLTDFGDDMHCQFLEILRCLLDTYAGGSQRDTIVEVFFEKHLVELIDAITSSCLPDDQCNKNSTSSDGGSRNQNCVTPEILLNICDLLCFCVLHHPYRIKCSFLLNNLIDRILYLTRRREKYLVVAAVRFLRTLISRSDEHVMNYFVKNNLFKPIVDAFVANGDRYNLLNSAILELFEYIRKENLKVLLRYLVDTFWDQLSKFGNFSSIQALKVKYEQSLESAASKSTGSLLDQRKRIDERALEKEEEDYFNEDSDEEDSASAQTLSRKKGQKELPVLVNGSSHPPPRSGGLVDYDDDEDDEDYRPPPKRTPEASEDDDGGTSFRLKRKLVTKVEPEPKRLQQSPNGVKTREGVFAVLRSTALPCKKIATAVLNMSQLGAEHNSAKPNVHEKGAVSSSEENQIAQSESQPSKKEAFSECSTDGGGDSADNRQQGDEENQIAQTDSDTSKKEASSECSSDGAGGSADNRQQGDDCSNLPTNTSPETTMSGS